MRASALLPCWVLAATVWPQAAPSQAAGPESQPEVVTHQAPATFSSRVDLVSVPVVIRDPQGRAIGGLKQEDFQLFDKGKLQVITKFTVQTSKPAPAAVPSSTAVAVSAAAPAEAASKPEFPDRYIAYFFDDIHMQPGDLLQARQAASHHLDQALDPGTRAGIFTSSGRTTLNFTNDVQALHATLNAIHPWTPPFPEGECMKISYYEADYLINREASLNIQLFPGPGQQTVLNLASLSPLLRAVLEEAAARCGAEADGYGGVVQFVWHTAQRALQQGDSEVSSSLNMLRDLAQRMSALPGNRTIVMVSPGFVLSALGEQRLDENAVLEGAVRANVVINALDIRGVHTPPEMQAENGGHVLQDGEAVATLMQADNAEATESGNLLGEIANGTGGTVHNNNDFEGGLKELAARPEYTYVLGFSPDQLKYDGSYHGLKVKLKEGAKFEIQARRGYWAPRRATDPAEAAKEQLKETLFSRDEIADIPLDLHADFFQPAAGKAEINVVARLDAKGLTFKKAGDRNDDTLTLVTGLFDQNGNYISGIERVVEMRLRDKSLEVLENSGISVAQSFSVSPGRYIVRVVVTDSDGRTTAARNTGIDVP